MGHSPPNPLDARTVELWFRADRLPADPGDGGFTEKQAIYDEGGTTRGAMIYLSGTQTGTDPAQADRYWAIWNRNGGGDGPGDPWGGFEGSDPSVNLSTIINKGEIYHLVATYQGDADFFGKLRLYVNGELVGETTDVDIIRLFFAHTNDGGFGARVSQGLYHDIGVGDAPAVSIIHGTDGTIQIDFTGTLQSAPSITGPWTDVAGGSPATINTSQAGALFFRAR